MTRSIHCAQLADRLDWSQLEAEFAELYSDLARLAYPIQLMVSLLLVAIVWNLQL